MKKMLYAALVCAIALAAGRPAVAWTNHSIMSYLILGGESWAPALVSVESIDDFLAAAGDGLGALFDAEEAWARKHIVAYSPRPDGLAYAALKDRAPRERFLLAARLNPTMRFPLYVQPRALDDPRPRLPWATISLYPTDYLQRPLVAVKPGERIPAIEVAATATNEPDDGFDMGLYEDNETPYGPLMGYGKQPISDSKKFTHSQAGFHMGFYHESWIVYAAAPILKKACPEQRVHLFYTLARYAFRTGHPYWGYRFAGMGAHYVADLTMPYHARAVPGVSTIKLLWYSVLNALGFSGAYERTVDRLANEHILIETMVYDALRSLFDAGAFGDPMLTSFADRTGDAGTPAYGGRFIADVVSLDANESSADVRDALESIIRDRDYFDHAADRSVEGSFIAEKVVAGARSDDRARFMGLMLERMKKQGVFVRAYLSAILPDR